MKDYSISIKEEIDTIIEELQVKAKPFKGVYGVKEVNIVPILQFGKVLFKIQISFDTYTGQCPAAYVEDLTINHHSQNKDCSFVDEYVTKGKELRIWGEYIKNNGSTETSHPFDKSVRF